MKILLDTNIIIDVLTKRKGYEDSLSLVKYCELGTVEGFVSATTVTDVMYILRKHLPPTDVRDALQILFLVVNVASVLKGTSINDKSGDYLFLNRNFDAFIWIKWLKITHEPKRFSIIRPKWAHFSLDLAD